MRPEKSNRPTLDQVRARLEASEDFEHQPERLRRLLDARGLTYKQAAELLGLSERAIAGYCNDPNRQMPYATWVAINFLTAAE